MKLNENYILKTVAGSPVVVPVGEAVNNIRGMITLNGPAEIIWKSLEECKNFEDITKIVKTEYDADEEVIKADVKSFLEKLKSYKILEGEID